MLLLPLLYRAIGVLLLAAAPTSFAADAVGLVQEPDQDPVVAAQISEYPSAPLQDRNGNLWIRTVLQGLVRYDGNEFVNFTKENGLGNDMVRDLLEDENGVLWIATGGGLTRYDGKSFQTLSKFSKASAVKSKGTFSSRGDHFELWDVFVDRNKRLWIASMDGVFWLDGNEFQRYPLPAMKAEHKFEFTPNMVYEIFQDRDGVMWFCTDGAGVIRDDGKTQTSFTVKDGLASNFVCTVVQDARGEFWFGTSNGGVSHFDGKKFTTHLRTKEYSEALGWGRFMGLHVDKNGDVWFGACGSVRGAYRYDGKKFHLYSKPDGLGDGHIASISEDRQGNLWFGTTAGVYRYDGKEFTNFTRDS